MNLTTINPLAQTEPTRRPMQIILKNLTHHLRTKGVSLLESQMELLDLCSDLNCWIAGGAPLALYQGRLEQIKDWDLYFRSKADLDEAYKEIINCGFEKTYESEDGISCSKDSEIVQLITRRYCNSVENIFISFDFSVCCFAIEDDTLFLTPQSKNDAEKCLININNNRGIHVNTIGRIARYGSKGFIPTADCMLTVAKELRNMSNEEFNDLKMKVSS